MKISINGHIVDANQAVISAYDHGFLYGIGCFETFRTYGGHVFLLDEHLQRLDASCAQLGIPLHLSAATLQKMVGELLDVNGLKDAYVRLSVSAGMAELGLPSEDYRSPTIILYMKPLPEYKEDLYRDGKPLQLLRLRRNSPEGELRFKSFHFMNNVLAKREMLQYPWAKEAEGLFLDTRGYLAEGIVSNLFFYKDERWYTPSLNTGILAGITRQFIIQQAASMDQPVQEGEYPLDSLLAADEIFLTNSVMEIVPVHRIFDDQGKMIWHAPQGCGPRTQWWINYYRDQARGGQAR